MDYYKIGVGKFVEIEGERARIFYKSELQKERDEMVARIQATVQPTKDELLAWAKQNYPFTDTSAEQTKLDEVKAVLTIINAL